MKKMFKIAMGAAGAALAATAAQAAGDGTGIQAGFTEVGTDLNTLLGGAGGYIIMIVSIIFGGVMLAIGRGWGQAVTAFAVALVLGYGVSALQGISGVTGTTDLLADSAYTMALPSGE